MRKRRAAEYFASSRVGRADAARRCVDGVDGPRGRVLFTSLFALWAAAIVFVLYARVLHAPFVFDDALLTGSRFIQATSLSQVGAVLAAPVQRNLTQATFAFNVYANQNNPFGYHLVNAGIHVVNSLLLFVLARLILQLLAADHSGRPHATTVAFLAATIWLVHPVQTQAVSYIWQRSTSLCALFFLISVIAFIKGRTTSGATRMVLFVAAAISGVLALMAKENAAALPGALVLIELTLFRSARAARPARPWHRALWFAAAGVAVLALTVKFLGPRFVAMMTADFERRGFSLGERLLTEARVVVHYISLLILPHPSRLTLDYDFVVSKGLLDPLTTAPSVLLILLLVGAGIAALRRAPLVALPILWFFGLLVIESTVIPLDLAYEHRLYLPSMLPIVFAAAALVAGVREGVQRPAVRLAIAACAIVLLAAWTWQRNEIWRDPVRLWTDTAAKSPNKARVHANLAKAQLDAGDPGSALQSYQRAYQLDPGQIEPLSAQALIYVTHYNDPAKARALLDEATRLSPRYVPALVNLGVVQMRSGETTAAADTFTRALSYDAHQRDALYNLAALSFNARDYAEAERRLERGIASWPAHARMHALLGLVYLKRGEPARSQQTLATAFSLAPGDPMVDAAHRELMKRIQ